MDNLGTPEAPGTRLLQHAANTVDRWPWWGEAFRRRAPSFAWPTHKIAVMGAEGAANVVIRR